MKKKKLLNLSAILLGALMCFSFNKVQATDSVFSVFDLTRDGLKTVAESNTVLMSMSERELGISARRETGNSYSWNPNTTGESKKVWKIANVNSNIRNYDDLYYCLNASRGFGISNGEMAEGATDIYKNSYDMKNSNNKTNISNAAGENLGENYNKVLWILDNSYIPGASTSIDRSNLLKKAYKYRDITRNFGAYLSNTLIDNNSNIDLTDEQIEVVQQLAIWHFTNGYNVTSDMLYQNGKQLNGINFNTSGENYNYDGLGVGYCREGEIVAWKMEALYNYFISGANENSSNYNSNAIPTLTLSNSNATVVEDGNYYVAGPFSLNGENTEQIKEITTNVNVQNYKLLDADKKEVTNNEFSKVIGSNFYLKIAKGQINQDTNINIDINYKYDNKTLKFMTDESDPTNTQPVVLVESEEKTKKIDTNINIELTEVSVEKVWEDNQNQDGKRPTSIKVALYEGSTQKDVQTLSNNNSWTYTWTGLLAGKSYSVVELNENDNKVEPNGRYNDDYTKVTYSISISGIKTTITNIHTPETTKVEGTKTWVDNENQDGKRPEKIIVNLYADGEKVDSKEVTSPWTYSFTNLPKYKNGTEIVYTVDEETVAEYTKAINGYNITNTYTPGKINKTVIKVWEDSNNEDKIQPRSIEVQLYKTVNGTKTSMGDEYKVTLDESNNWTYPWSDLDEKENGTNIIYSVEETNVPSGYTVKYSANDYSSTDTITITNTHIVEEPTGKYNVVLRKVDNEGNELSGAKIKINGKEYTVGKATISKDVNITSTDSITLEYTLEEVTAPEGYIGLATPKDIKIKLEIKKSDKTYKVIRAYLVDSEGQKIDSDNEISVNLEENTSTITIDVVNNPILPEFDLALRKFITKINDKGYDRAPKVDTSTIASTGTATYQHTKEPLAVQVGDIVTYTIRVYNEGETDGYASEITDHLPEWLDFLPEDETNKAYLWTQDINNNRKITTNITSKDSASGEELYNNRPNKQLLSAYKSNHIEVEGIEPATLDYIDVQIVCRVNEKAVVKQLITNIAEISEMQDKEGTEVITDRDSTRGNFNFDGIDVPNYEGTENDNGYYKGQEDDDDFEKIIVENFDLSLRKFITAVNEKTVEPSREPVVDTTKLGEKDEEGNTITTATYTHSKEPVKVSKGDIITYTIRVYNEGTLAGFANEVVDYIPEGLEFIEDSSINISNGWRIEDGKIVTNHLSDSNLNNVINGVTENAEGKKELSYKDVQVQFRVVADPVEYADSIITNWAEISEDSNNDIDSTPGNNVKEEDDIDYEPIELTYFDLALRKFITNVDGTEYNNRVPEVDTSKMGTIDEETGNKITTATYTHTKDPIVLETGSTVIYTIRVYNEGTMAGYATEITDNIPEGLEFLPENEINSTYKWIMIDEEGNITQDVSKAVKITTNYLTKENGTENIISAYQESNGNIALDYKDVKVAFKVTEPNTSDRVVINTAEISKDSDEDIDSIPGNNANGEDDIDNEYVKVETFDLSLKKWVTATKVTYDGKTKTTKTGFNENSTEMAKVDLVGSKLKKTTVKFVYNIKVTNEGEVAGYATEIKDYIPSGLKFVAEDNPDWTLQKDGTVTTDKLKDTLLEPGQSATVEITLTWKNSSTNMGVKTNWAEISADSGDDVDSTPDNYNKIEDDIDDAKVILSIKTGSTKMYIALAIISIAILGGGTFLIKKYVINK